MPGPKPPTLHQSAQSRAANAQFLAYYAMASVLTVLTSNDVVILTLTPIVIHFAKASHTDPAPLLFATFYAANTWGMTLLIGQALATHCSGQVAMDTFLERT